MSASSSPNGSVSIVGGSVVGTWHALLFAEAGWNVTLYERDGPGLPSSAGHWAGGMLAPDCEAESAETIVSKLGLRSLDLWKKHYDGARFEGSLVLAHARDRADLERFARVTSGYKRISGATLDAVEPVLAGRFPEGLFFPNEGHVEPRKALPALHEKLKRLGVDLRYNSEADCASLKGWVIDCRGLAARDKLPDLRGVKGEIAVIETRDVQFTRPVRLLHPRWPIYVVPRGDGRFLIGATQIEAEDRDITVRGVLELLTSAYSLHPAFAEARILEIGAGLRPAFPDNLPRIAVDGEQITVNGLYRHGFLLAPALAELTLNYVTRGARENEIMRWN